jgi:hypothetical protein
MLATTYVFSQEAVDEENSGLLVLAVYKAIVLLLTVPTFV